MSALNSEIKKVLERFKKTQSEIEVKVKQMEWVKDARRMLDRQQDEFSRLQKQVPTELKKLKKFVDSQKRDLEKLLGKLKTKKKPSRKKGATKARSRKPAASGASSQA